MSRRATQTREIDVLSELLRRVQRANKTGDYAPVEEMIDPDVALRTADGEKRGVDSMLRFFHEMGAERYRASIVAPRGGLVTVLISPVTSALGWGRSHEQVYRLNHDKLVGLIDLGRTPDQVFRPRSQPN